MSDPAAPGRDRIVRASWVTTGVLALTSLPLLFWRPAGLEIAATGVALASFAAGLVVWVMAFAGALARNARGEEISVASLFFLSGSAPAPIRRSLLSSLAASTAVALAAGVVNPFGILAPMLPLGLAGLWGARHGTFPPAPGSECPTGTGGSVTIVTGAPAGRGR